MGLKMTFDLIRQTKKQQVLGEEKNAPSRSSVGDEQNHERFEETLVMGK